MEAMDAERLELYDLLKPKLDEEPARRLVLALPAHPSGLVTSDRLVAALAAQDARFEARLATQTDRLTWRMITVVGAWTVIATSLFAFMSRVFG